MEKSELCTREYSDLSELTSSYNSTLTSLLNKHAPMKEKVVVCRQRLPWFNSEIIKVCYKDEAKGGKEKARTNPSRTFALSKAREIAQRLL